MSQSELNRALIVGFGSIGQLHLRIARFLLPTSDIFVLRHQKCESVPEHANGCISSIDEALDFAPHAAVVCNPSPFHMQIAQPLAEAGVHLLVEKPLASSSEGVSDLISTCTAGKLVLMTAYNLRFRPCLQEYRRLILSGCIGRVMSVRCEVGQYLPSWRTSSDYRHGVSGSRALGGGALLELSHELDYLRWIFGEIASVKATLSNQSDLEIDVEDTAHLILEFYPSADGRKLIATLNLDFVRQDATRKCTAIGEKGSLRWNGQTGVVEFFAAGGAAWMPVLVQPTQREHSYTLEWQHFLKCIREGGEPFIDGRDGLAVLKIIEAARLSATENRSTPVHMDNQT